jgi:hypothetical protein
VSQVEVDAVGAHGRDDLGDNLPPGCLDAKHGVDFKDVVRFSL